MAADPRPPKSQKREPTTDERAARDAFKQRVLLADGHACVVHRDDEDDCDGELQAHHVVSQQQLRNAGRHDLLWEWRNGMTICERAHRRHTLATRRILRDDVPERCKAFVAAHGFEGVLSRYYAPRDA